LLTSDKTSDSSPAKPRAIRARGIRGRSDKLPSLLIFPALVLVIASLYWGQAVLIPVALSILFTFLLSPVVSGVQQTGLGRIPAVILIVVLAFSLLGGIVWVVTLQLTSVANELPTYRKNILQKIADVRGAGKGGALESVQKTAEDLKAEFQKQDEPAAAKAKPREVIVKGEETSTFWPLPLATAPMLERLAAGGLVIVLVIFMLIQREDLRNRIFRLVGYGQLTITTKALEEIGDRISRYLLMQSIINGVFGLGVAIGLFFIGLPYAILWGFLAAVLRFIPYIGSLVAAILPIAFSLAVFSGWVSPLLVIALFVIVEPFIGMVLEPLLYGESVGVSGVALLISISFWTWLWGPIGLLLATPLTVCIVVLGKYIPQLEFFAVLLSDEPVMETKVTYYQRLLAIDQDEAAEIVEEHLKSHSREEVYDDVLIPALNYVKRDFDLGRLAENDQQFVFQATREIIGDLDGFKSENSSFLSASAETVTSVDVTPPAAPTKIRITGCPVRDEADEISLLMLRQLLDPDRYEFEILADELLVAEIVERIAAKNPALICFASLPPGGLAQTRYLCKRLRAQFPDSKLVVGRWGSRTDNSNALAAAGADRVGNTIIETRDHIIQLSQIVPG
jgi:predicted PurR-regulated permease PerM